MKTSCKIFKKENLKLVQLRYYELNKGLLILQNPSYVIVYKNEKDNEYNNVINVKENYPMFKVSPYPCEINGEVYGHKIYNNPNVTKSGLCYLDINIKNFLGEDIENPVRLDQIKNYILNSKLYFKDRELIAKENVSLGNDVFKSLCALYKDYDKNIETRKFINEIKKEKEKVK